MRFLRGAWIVVLVLALAGLSADRATPAFAGEGVKAVVVRSWSDCGSTGVIWREINANWANHGTTPIHIDYTIPDLCYGPVTYEALAASGADVLIISDPAGGIKQYGGPEVAAIRRYVREGHGIVGSFLFYYLYASPGSPSGRRGGSAEVAAFIDNRPLLRMFGLPVEKPYSVSLDVPADYHILVEGHPLFRGIDEPFASEGYASDFTPLDGSWGPEDLAGAEIVARTRGAQGVITTFHDRTYGAVYVSSMPEFRGGAVDAQFWYNAITYAAS